MFFNGLKEKKHHHLHYLRTLQGVLGMLRDSSHTESVFDIEEGLRDTEASELAAKFAMEFPEVRALAAERYLRRPPDVDEMCRLPKGTLGYRYGYHLRSNGFDPDYYRKIDVRNDMQYLAMRMRQTHDIWHVITGFDVSPIGELGLKACELAQTRRPMAAVITAGGVLRYLLKEPELLPDVMDAMARGYSIGHGAKPLLGPEVGRAVGHAGRRHSAQTARRKPGRLLAG